MKFRTDINGLRGIAVLCVITYHAGLSGLTGGFIGVDVFFVISGYLITNIITTALVEKDFSFTLFYVKRIKRLLPAAVTLIFFSVLIGTFFLPPNDYKDLAESAIYSNFLSANFFFLNHSGYFDLSTKVSPLVHMWSLSIEEQFYLIFPVLLYLSYKFGGINFTKYMIITTTLFSFLAGYYLSFYYPRFSFYMLLTRAWELGIGALIVFIPPINKSKIWLPRLLVWLGAATLFFSLLIIKEKDIYPGYLAAFPVLATALIIYSLQQHNSIIKTVITIKPLLWMGKISYSAYLWHWPIIVYYRIYISQQHFSYLEIISLIIASVIFGYLSWRFIEEKSRYTKWSTKDTVLYSICALIITSSFPFFIYQSKGLPLRLTQQEINIVDYKAMKKLACVEYIKLFDNVDEKFCVIGRPWNHEHNKGVVWGDSHSLHYSQILHQAAIKSNMSLVIAPQKCPPYLNSKIIKEEYPKFPTFTDDCTFRNKLTLNWLLSNDDIVTVIMAAAWSGHIRQLYDKDINQVGDLANGKHLSSIALDKVLSYLTKKNILLLGDIPRPNKYLNGCVIADETFLIRKNCDDKKYKFLDAQEIKLWHKESNQVLKIMADKFSNVESLIATDFLCNNEICDTFINNEFIYRDNNHLRLNLNIETINEISFKLGLKNYLN